MGDHSIKKKNMMTKEQKRILITYFLENIKHPYVNNLTKKELMAETGLKVDQIANWFMNVRKRLWLPTLRKNKNITQKRLREMVQLKFEQDILEQYTGSAPEAEHNEDEGSHNPDSRFEGDGPEDENPINFMPSLKMRKREHKLQMKLKEKSSGTHRSEDPKLKIDVEEDEWKQSQIEFFNKHNAIQGQEGLSGIA